MFHGNKNTVFGIKISRYWLGIRIHVYPSTCQWVNIISLSNTRVYQLTLIYNLLNDAATQRLAISLGTVYGGHYRVGGATDQQLIWSRPQPPQESHLYQFADTFSPSKITENSLPLLVSLVISTPSIFHERRKWVFVSQWPSCVWNGNLSIYLILSEIIYNIVNIVLLPTTTTDMGAGPTRCDAEEDDGRGRKGAVMEPLEFTLQSIRGQMSWQTNTLTHPQVHMGSTLRAFAM